MRHILFLFSLAVFFSYCANTPSRPDPVMTQAQHDRVNQESAAIQAQQAQQAAVASAAGSGLAHYYCATHPGEGGGSAGTCSQCGNAYTHNQAFHNAPAAGAPVTPGAAPEAGAEPAINAEGIWHYTCPNGHTGGGGSATPCAECGTTLVHNTAYHNSSATPAATTTGTPDLNSILPPSTTEEPPINAAGVYHYTCPNGHTGGGGSATPCGECGTTLVHNTAYHN